MRFEEEALLLIEQGKPLDEHFDTCEDCVEQRRKYEQLGMLVGSFAADRSPHEGWKRRIMDALHTQQHRPQRSYWRATIGIAASIAIVGLALKLSLTPPVDVDLDIEIIAGDTVYRGNSAKPGDSLQLTAVVTGSHGELRLYRTDGRLILACVDEPPCARADDRISATVTVAISGSYRAVAISSSEPVPAATVNLDADVLTARELGAEVEVSDLIIVR